MSSVNGEDIPQGICTPQLLYSALSFPTEDDFIQHVLESISSSSQHEEITYRHVPTAWGEAVWTRLDETGESRSVRKHYNSWTNTLWLRIMPTFIHDVHQPWFDNEKTIWTSTGTLTVDESLLLSRFTETTASFVQGPYIGSRKEPNLMVIPDDQQLPSFVIESGWSESLSRLRDDVNLWLLGGTGQVKAVLILGWRKTEATDRVAGTAEYYTLDRNGVPVLHEEHVIFPPPPYALAEAQVLRLTRQVLFGDSMAPGTNPDDIFPLRFDALRDLARGALARMDLVPA